jgi:putative phosphoserine phosphatase/1-acylglycerol-3-phosphate O-acyltransferase
VPVAELPVPGSLAEVRASPRGPRVAAFIDFDGTVILGFSASVVTQDRMRRREIGSMELFRTAQVALATGLGRAGFSDLMRLSAFALAGQPEADHFARGEQLYHSKIEDRVYPEMRAVVGAHQAQGHTVVLLSSATRFQVDAFARSMGIEHVICNELESDDEGRLTGEVCQPVVWGTSKATAAQAFAAEHDIDLDASYFYADGDEDAALMHLVGHPRPTNPRRRLEATAKRRGWPISRYSSRGSVSTVGRLRNLIGISSFGPVSVGAVAAGVLARNKRVGVDFALTRGVDALFRSAGVRLDVQGREHLWSQRPAVFLFNHRNQFDILIAGRLIESGFTSVGKKEAADNPVSAALGSLIDAVFIDRSDSVSAVEAMRPVEIAVKEKGLSLVISPEGTRTRTGELMPFKKGPFRIAMAAGVPVVPIVLRNADEIAPRDALMMRPGTIDVVVLPPVPTVDWTLEDLPERIAEVRQQFLDTLADWPTEASP